MKPKALLIMMKSQFENVYGPQELAAIREMCDLPVDLLTDEEALAHPELLKDVEILFSSWGCVKLDAKFLAMAPKLKAVFYAAGSVRGFTTKEMWDRGIVLTSSWAANGTPVAEMTLGEIILSLKRFWTYQQPNCERLEGFPQRVFTPGLYHSTVGLVSLGMIGKKVARLLQNFEVEVIAYDPFAKHEATKELNVKLVSLDEVFQQADVISLHTPWLKETENMIRGSHFEMMKNGATFINTARGAVVAEEEMLDVLEKRPDLTALLDVTWPEPPALDSRVYKLSNVFHTPHIAGSLDGECRRMAHYAIEECRRYLNGEPLKWQITEKMAATLA